MNGIAVKFEDASISWGETIRKKEEQRTEKKKPNRGNYSRVEPDLTTERGDVILEHINLEIRQGEFVAVIGEVCSGKTTFLHSILG